MKTIRTRLVLVAVVAILGGAAPAPQNEAALRQLVGTRVTVLMDMPATQSGIDYYPQRSEKIAYDKYRNRIRETGIAIDANATATITEIKIKGKHIEFQLDGGGYGNFGDYEPTKPNVPYPAKTRREEDLERDLRDETDINEKRRIERQIDDLRDQRERDYQRDRQYAEEQYRRDVERVDDQRVRAGSRINVRFDRDVPAQTKTVGGLQASLSELIDFGTEVESSVEYGADDRRCRSLCWPATTWTVPITKGMSQFDVRGRLGPSISCNEEASGSLTSVTCNYDLGESTAEVVFVNNAVVGYVIRSR